MQRDTTNEAEAPEGEKLCLQCKKIQPLSVFSRRKRKTDEYGKICCACERFNQDRRHHRVAAHRETWQEQGREEKRRKAWEKSTALRQAQEERWRERENWYLQQPDRCCRTCHQVQPASAFAATSSANGLILYTRCTICHEALQERHWLACCLCQERKPHRDFLSHFNEYALSGSGTSISLCCKECEVSFLALPVVQQSRCIRSCCQRTFPIGQVIYAEVDPETGKIRYIGRTGKPKRRHAQHLCDASLTRGQGGSTGKAWHMRSNWIQVLADRSLTPSMKILQTVEVSPLVVEWEQRYIWHGIQQGWNLLNVETMDEELVARVKASSFDFLKVPFEMLVQEHFFSPHGLAAFLHEWSQPAPIVE